MRDQRHIINELHLELKIPKGSGAYEIQNRISVLVNKEFSNLIAEYCDELVDPDILYRLENIEIDLGILNINSLEEDFSKTIKPLLFEAISSVIKSENAESSGQSETKAYPKLSSRVELLNQFLKTGNLTWWADNQDPQLLQRALSGFVASASETQVFAWVQKLRQSPVAVERLVRNFNDDSLFSLVEKISGLNSRKLLEQLVDFLRKNLSGIPSLKNKMVSPARNRVVLWQFVFFKLDSKEEIFSTKDLAINFFIHLSSAFKVPSKDVFRDLNNLRNSGQLHGQLFPEELDITIEQLSKIKAIPIASSKKEREEKTSTQPMSFKSVVANLLHLISKTTLEINGFRDNQKSFDLPGSNQKTKIKTFLSQVGLLSKILDSERNQGEELATLSISAQEKILKLRSLLKNAPDLKTFHKWLTSPSSKLSEPVDALALRKWTDELNLLISSLHEQLSAPSESKTKEKKRPRKRPSIKEGEEIYVNNAGLVLLAPFYKLFFSHLELTTEDKFVSEVARFKAMQLLHYLSYGEENTLEFLLPLNKVICGLDVSEPIELDFELSHSEKEECSNLIQAAVGHAPILKNISVDGFRGSFILRNGILSTRDQNWLLQVEKQSYDVVLDKIPWSYNILKLPWMDKLMYVEW